MPGVVLSDPETRFEREDTVMGFSARQNIALKRNLDHRYVRTRSSHGRELSSIEGWYAISEENRIFGFDGWSRETLESKCRQRGIDYRSLTGGLDVRSTLIRDGLCRPDNC